MTSKEEWEEIGSLSKRIRTDIQRLRIKSQNMVSKKSSKQIDIALNAINEFKDQAEIDMFLGGLRDITVFFGESDNLYPVEYTPVELFLEDFEWSGRIGASELYEAYLSWNEKKRFETLSSTAFGKEVSKRHKKIKNNVIFYLSEER